MLCVAPPSPFFSFSAPWKKSEGPAKPKPTDPPVHLLNPRPTHPPAGFYFLPFFLVSFWAFLGKGSSKTPAHIFTKSACRKLFPKKIDKNFHVGFPSIFLFYRVFGFFEAMGVQKHYEKRFTKNRVETFLQKNPQKSKTDFLSIGSFYHVFGRFSAEGVQKHHF
jgi:hypothetical protein